MDFKEIETKYCANNIKLKDFRTFCKSIGFSTEERAGSFDHYYEKTEGEFIRYRAGQKPEITVKRKTKKKNNFVRIEVNLPLDKTMSELERATIVNAFCKHLGFYPKFTIYKSCQMYFYKKFNLVYYVVFDTNLTIRGKFIEIEMNEKYPWPNKKSAWLTLLKIEKKMSRLGIKKRNRINESLYEMFRGMKK